jgi:hypothetical protein
MLLLLPQYRHVFIPVRYPLAGLCSHKSSFWHFSVSKCASASALMRWSIQQWQQHPAGNDLITAHCMTHQFHQSFVWNTSLHKCTYLAVIETKFRRHSLCFLFMNCYTNAQKVNQVTLYVGYIVIQKMLEQWAVLLKYEILCSQNDSLLECDSREFSR